MYSIATKKVVKRDKSIVNDFEFQVKDIRQQFIDQVKCLEIRTDAQSSLLAELQDFYRRRADIEADYSKNLEKFSRQLAAKQKADKPKRDGWHVFSLHAHYQHLVEEVKVEARNRAALADLYLNHVSWKFSNLSEQLQRISKRCREISGIAQQEILRVLTELHTAMKTFQLCQAASWVAENKFRVIEAQKLKFEEANPKKIGARKHRFLEKEFEKKQGKFDEFLIKALKFKNEYLLCIDAANAALHKYFADDLSDLLDCCDVGCEEWLKRLLDTVSDCRQAALDAECRHVRQNRDFSRDLDHRADKRRFLDAHHCTFTLPRKFGFKQHTTDRQTPAPPGEIVMSAGDQTPPQLVAHKTLKYEYAQRYWQLNDRLLKLKTETEEIWKTLETAEKTLMDIQKMPEVQWSVFFASNSASSNFSYSNNQCVSNSTSSTPVVNGSNSSTANASATELARRNSCRETESSQHKRKQDLCEIEDFYLQKFQQYLLASNLIRRLEARHDAIRNALGALPAQCDAFSLDGATLAPLYSTLDGAAHFVNGGDKSVICENVPLSLGQHYQHYNENSTTVKTTDGVESSPSPNITSESSSIVAVGGAVRTRRKKRIGVSSQAQAHHRPRLFGGTIEEYVEATGQHIPLILRSCVRMLSMYGLHHQGVFRVSGSQIEINCFRDAFERGEDPLSNVSDASDVNSVAGVMKLYFRELREPLFPIFMFDQFVECSRIENKVEFARKVQELVLSLPRPVFVVMRYLFAFLNHLSEFSDENMMDPYNLAICFGPTLLSIPESRDQVFYHNHVNELMKNMIALHREIFPKNAHPGTPMFEKYLLTTVGAEKNIRNSMRAAKNDNNVIEVTGGDTSASGLVSKPSVDNQDDDDIDEELMPVGGEHVDDDNDEFEDGEEGDTALMTSLSEIPAGVASPTISGGHRLSSNVSTKSPLLGVDRLRSVSGGSRRISAGVDPLLELSMHGSLRMMDDVESPTPPVADANAVWLRRPVTSQQMGGGEESTARHWQSGGEQRQAKPINNDTYSLYANMHTSILGGYGRRSPQVSPNSLASSRSTTDRSSSCCSSYPNANAANTQSMIGKFDSSSPAMHHTSLTRSYYGANVEMTSHQVATRAPLSETLALKQHDKKTAASLALEDLARGRSAPGGHGKVQALVPPMIHTPIFSINNAMKKSVDSSGYHSMATDDTDTVHHHPPKGLSPTSLKEIQVELKAVLNSLESFTSQHQQQQRLSSSSGGSRSSATAAAAGVSSTFDAAAVERRFGLSGLQQPSDSGARAAQTMSLSTSGATRPPDLVQNLPASVGPQLCTSVELSTARAKPPIPRKPSMSSPAASPRLNRRFPDTDKNNSSSSNFK